MELIVKLLVLGILAQALVFNINIVGAVEVPRLPPCNFSAIYNFGDSNSDTSNAQSTNISFQTNDTSFSSLYTRKFSDGRLLVDFMAEKLKLLYVNAYLSSNGTNLQQGANFAVTSASIWHVRSGTTYNLDVQIDQFDQFKARTKNTNTTNSRIPKPEEFSKALYTLDIGQNDFTNFYWHKVPGVQAHIPNFVNQFTAAIKHLYEQGGRTFWIHNTAPLGCFPFTEMFLVKGPVPESKDQNGCNAFINEMSKEFNSQLKASVNKLRVELPEAALTYVDLYTPMLELMTNYKNLGFNQIFIDSIHRNEAANGWLADKLLDGSFSDPPLPITHACHKRVAT